MPKNPKEMYMANISKLAKNAKSKEEFNKIKHRLAKNSGLKEVPKNAEIFSSIKKENNLDMLLKTKPVRTISGVAPVAIMTQPIACPPQAQCTYCPGGPSSIFGHTPKSYTDGAPAVKRAIRNKYDPYFQTLNRLEHYILLNQNPSKVELIIMGGTFPSFPKTYRTNFITYALKAMNDFSDKFYKNGVLQQKAFNKFFLLPGNMNSKEREEILLKKMEQNKGESTLEKEQGKNETKKIRCTAMVIETRPDCCFEPEINDMLSLGATRVELGVQNIKNKVLEITKRGHSVGETIKASQLLKDSFLKTTYHMMLGSPLTTSKSDIDDFKELFSNPDFKPDSLKIYPCLVMAGTPLYEDYKKGKFTPMNTEDAIKRIITIKKHIPEYCRIMRIQRDIPTYMTEAGVDRTNLRQMISNKLKEAKEKCRCIRCREPKNKEVDYSNIKTKIKKYDSSNGTEIFISKEDVKKDIILGYVRLRIPFKPFRKEITSKSAGIRELHVFGTALDLKKSPKKSSEAQHRGLGKQLMLEAEKIAKEEYEKNKMLVISGIGVREYYKRQLGYTQDGPYVSKKI
ncbi:MAG: tRNA uridine(34) 5-carboxymethylaminomethyl modification radical SAM/GNAT enzyme Elp3 [Nanoarchaeota archaeon]|nr:tRNA uridine(34) 5-carboxymethylaminomethyl modification radical SAM/GNAT enzyme Elp3 [Nanoarchaeota archaeon]